MTQVIHRFTRGTGNVLQPDHNPATEAPVVKPTFDVISLPSGSVQLKYCYHSVYCTTAVCSVQDTNTVVYAMQCAVCYCCLQDSFLCVATALHSCTVRRTLGECLECSRHTTTLMVHGQTASVQSGSLINVRFHWFYSR